MHWIQKVALIVLILCSNICMYAWGRRDGFDRCQQLILEYFLEKIKERDKDDGMDN